MKIDCSRLMMTKFCVVVFFIFISFILLGTPVFSQPYHEEKAVLKNGYIYDSAPFPECHASTLVQTTKGTILAAWFGGEYEKHPQVGIWLSRLVDGQWSPPVEVVNGKQADGTQFASWNPVLFQPKNGPLLLFFKVGESPDSWWGEMMTSEDDGLTWKNQQKLPNHGIGPVRAKPIQLESGEILCPSSNEEGNMWLSHVETTADNGKTWKRTPPLHTPSEAETIQPTFLVHPDNKLQLLMRNRDAGGKIMQIWSEDGGKTWGKIHETELPNPNSGIDAVSLQDGRFLLIYNHTNRHRLTNRRDVDRPVPTGRTMINLAVSDNGIDWKAVAILELAPRSEFSYPAMIQTADGLVHITYTWNRIKVRHLVIDPVMIEGKPIVDGVWPNAND